MIFFSKMGQNAKNSGSKIARRRRGGWEQQESVAPLVSPLELGSCRFLGDHVYDEAIITFVTGAASAFSGIASRG